MDSDAPPDIALRLPGYLPATPNTLRGKHWAIVRRERQRAAWHLAAALLCAGMPTKSQPVTGSRWQLHLVRQGPGTLDRDNLSASYKQLQDAIVSAGLIHDDSPRVLWATHSDRPTRHAKSQGTVVLLRRVPDGSDLLPWHPQLEAHGGF